MSRIFAIVLIALVSIQIPAVAKLQREFLDMEGDVISTFLQQAANRKLKILDLNRSKDSAIAAIGSQVNCHIVTFEPAGSHKTDVIKRIDTKGNWIVFHAAPSKQFINWIKDAEHFDVILAMDTLWNTPEWKSLLDLYCSMARYVIVTQVPTQLVSQSKNSIELNKYLIRSKIPSIGYSRWYGKQRLDEKVYVFSNPSAPTPQLGISMTNFLGFAGVYPSRNTMKEVFRNNLGYRVIGTESIFEIQSQ